MHRLAVSAAVSAVLLALVLAVQPFQAQAQTKVKFSGFYKVYHENDVNFLRSPDKDHQDNDSFFWHRLQLTVDFIPTENVTIRWITRGPNTVRWGAVPYGDGRGAGQMDLYTRAIFAAVTTDYGKFTIGRHNSTMLGNIAGLESLGYAPKFGDFLVSHMFDWNLPFDGITYTKSWDNGFGVNIAAVKERSVNNPGIADADSDRISIEPFFKWDGGGASVEVAFARDQSAAAGFTHTDIINGQQVTFTHPVQKNWLVSVNPALILNWGPAVFHLEAKAAWSETVYQRRAVTQGNTANLAETKVKNTGLGVYADGVWNYGPGTLTLGGWYFDGNAPDEGGGPRLGRKTGHDLVGTGSFSPFLVAYGASIGLGAGHSVNVLDNQERRGTPAKYTIGNHWAVGLLGDHFLTKDIKFHWGLGFFRAVNPWGRHLIGYAQNGDRIEADDSKDLGYEADLGVVVKVLENVTWESHFGYFVNGDAHKTYDDTIPGPGRKSKDTYAWANALIFSF